MAWLGIEEDLKAIRHILQFLTPGQSELEQADHLQREHSLDPFDSIILAQTIFLKGTLITRDRTLLDIAESFVPCFTPEKFLDHCMDDQVND